MILTMVIFTGFDVDVSVLIRSVHHLDYFRIGFNLGALGTLVLSWNYMKNANRAAARALQQEHDAQV